MATSCPAFNDIAREYRTNYKRPDSAPSCHCMNGGGVGNAGGVGNGDLSKNTDDNFFKHDIALNLIDVYGRPLTGQFKEYIPKTLADYQYSSLNKNPSYFLDLSQNIGLRPIVSASDIEAPPKFKYTNNGSFGGYTKYNCNQPEWGPKCI